MGQRSDPEARVSRAALALRIAGATYEEVADELGYRDGNTARVAIERELGRWAQEKPEERERLRTLASARLDALLRSVWDKATDSADPEHLASVKVALSLVDRSVKLHGLDAPTEVVLHSPTEVEIEQWVARMVTSGATSYGDVVDAEVITDVRELAS